MFVAGGFIRQTITEAENIPQLKLWKKPIIIHQSEQKLIAPQKLRDILSSSNDLKLNVVGCQCHVSHLSNMPYLDVEYLKKGNSRTIIYLKMGSGWPITLAISLSVSCIVFLYSKSSFVQIGYIVFIHFNLKIFS